MKVKNCTVKFYLKPSTKKGEKEDSIYCRIIYDRKKSEFFTGEKINPVKWLPDSGLPKKAPRLEEYLFSIKNDLLSKKRELEYLKKPITAKRLKEYFRLGDKVDEIYFLDYFNKQVEKFGQLSGEYAEGTLKRYRVTSNHYNAFLEKTGINGILLDEFDLSVIRDFDYYLLTVPSQQYKKPMGRNSANNYHKKIKKVLGVAVKEKLIPANPYMDFPIKDEKSNIEFLTKDELNAITNHPLAENKSLIKVRDIFLFSCYTGLRYQDAQNLQNNNIHKDSDGDYWLTFEQQKIKNKREVFPMLKPAIDLYQSYELNREITGFILPRMSNTKINVYLKTIANLVGIQKKLTHHVARHTFATTVTLGNDMPLEMVSAFLGHSDIRTTQIYAKLTPNYKLKYAKAVNEKLK